MVAESAGAAVSIPAPTAPCCGVLEADGRPPRAGWPGAGAGSERGSAAIGGWPTRSRPACPSGSRFQSPCSRRASWGLREVPHRDGTSAQRSHLARPPHRALHLWHHRGCRRHDASVALGLSTRRDLADPAAAGRGVHPAWFGPLWAGAHAWLALVSLASGRVVGALGVRPTLLGCCLLVPLGYVGLAASTSAWGAAFYLCFMTIRGLQAPILTRIMQEHAPGEDRASVLSLAALLFRLAFVVVGPPVGLLVDRAGMTAALAVLAVIFTPVTLAALAAFSRAHRGACSCDSLTRWPCEIPTKLAVPLPPA